MNYAKKLFAVAALALATTAAHAETNVLLFGISHHVSSNMGHAKGYNEFNPGLGLEWGKEPWWYVGALTYRDSYYKQAYAAYGGVRGKVELGYDFHLEGGLRLGYLNGSGWHGAMVMPTVGIGYKNVAMELTFLPPVNSGEAKDGVIALWLRFTL